jgi:hypothetical protein
MKAEKVEGFVDILITLIYITLYNYGLMITAFRFSREGCCYVS